MAKVTCRSWQFHGELTQGIANCRRGRRSDFRLTFEPNFTVGLKGRLTVKDLFKANIQLDRVFTFQNWRRLGRCHAPGSGRPGDAAGGTPRRCAGISREDEGWPAGDRLDRSYRLGRAAGFQDHWVYHAGRWLYFAQYQSRGWDGGAATAERGPLLERPAGGEMGRPHEHRTRTWRA